MAAKPVVESCDLVGHERRPPAVDFKVKAVLVRQTRDADGKVKLAPIGQPVPRSFAIHPDPHASKVGDRTKVEAARLAIALAAALIGLMAGAREQLLKLDVMPALFSVFLMGFGADVIKNLIAPPGARSSVAQAAKEKPQKRLAPETNPVCLGLWYRECCSSPMIKSRKSLQDADCA
jgi:hypothetical protein